MNDLTTAEGLADGFAEAGSWAELGRRTGIPATTLKSRAKRLKALEPQARVETWDSYHEEMAEFLATSGFSGYRVHGAMLHFCEALGLSREAMFEVASRAAELARCEYEWLMRDMGEVWERHLGESDVR